MGVDVCGPGRGVDYGDDYGETWVWSAPSGGLCPASASAIWTEGPGRIGTRGAGSAQRRRWEGSGRWRWRLEVARH